MIIQADFQDFLKELESNSVDLMLTDPPYAISKPTGFHKVKNGVERFAVSMDFGEWDANEINLDALAFYSFNSLRKGGTAVIFYDIWKLQSLRNAMMGAGYKMLRQIIWQKTNPVPLNMKSIYLSNSREMAVVGVKGGKPTFNSEYDNGVYHYPIPRNRKHPTQKPIHLFSELVKKHSNEGDLVIDPFLGSGTTAVAALQQNRLFKGCDLDEEYVIIAKERINSEVYDG